MEKKKRSIGKTIIVVLVCCLVAAGIVTGAVFGGIRLYNRRGSLEGAAATAENFYSRELPALHTASDGSFRILQISDTHLTTAKTKSDRHKLTLLQTAIEEHSPDLVVLAGDIANDGDAGIFNKKQIFDTLGSLFEELELYWAYIPGNNDGLNYGTSEDVCAYLSSYPHCLVADEPDLTGGAQYTVDLYNGSKLVHSLIFMDTNDYNQESSSHIYGYLHDDQIAWADAVLAEKTKSAPDIRTSVFLHENTPAFAQAAKDGEGIGGDYSPVTESNEKYNIPENAALDDVLAKYGCTGLVSMGHKHPEKNECSFWNGTYYHITATAGTAASLITLHTNALTAKEMYEFEYIDF